MRGLTRRGIVTAALAGLTVFGALQAASAAIIPVKALVAQILLDRAFDQSVATHRRVKPWAWADMAPAARLTVPRLGVHRIAIDSGSGQALAFGPTVLRASAQIGEPGTIVIAAHRDTHFRFLAKLKRGDRIEVAGIDGKTSAYRVTGAEIVRNDRFAIPADRDDRQLILTTCYPFGSHSHGRLRFVVHALPV